MKPFILPFLHLIFLLYSPVFGLAQEAFFHEGQVIRVDSLIESGNIGYRTYFFRGNSDPLPQSILSSEMDSAFIHYSSFNTAFDPDTFYWGAFKLENQGPSQKYLVQFPQDVSEFTFYEVSADGILEGRAGSLVPDDEEVVGRFASRIDYIFETDLPTGVQKKYYYRFRDESGIARRGFFAPNIWEQRPYFENKLEMAKLFFFFTGAVAIFLLLNLIFFIYLREKPFLYYVFYLASIGCYGLYSSSFINEVDIIPGVPLVRFYLRLNYYLISITYLAFIRSFLDLKRLLPWWDWLFKWLIRVAFSCLTVSVLYLAFFRYDIAFIDSLYGIYLLVAFVVIVAFLYPLYRSPGINSKFIFWGSIFIFLGVLPSIYRLIFSTFTIQNVLLVQMGLLGEMVVFSLGLAYSQSQKEKAKQEAVKKSELVEEKSRLYTNFTHEFRTPLTVIGGMINRIEGNEEERNIIARNSQNLLSLVNKILDLQKLESDTMPVHWIQADVVQYLRYILESFHSLAELKKIRLHFMADPETVMMDYDQEKLLNITSNLISNAIKYSQEENDVYIQVSVIDREEGRYLKLLVKDNGIGIAKDQIDKIFDRFYQVDDPMVRKQEGTGIGLALTRELVKLLDGEISVKSIPGKGATFTVLLPIRQTALIQEAPTLEHEPTADVSPSFPAPSLRVQSAVEGQSDSPLVLIIEDNADVAQYIASCLQSDYQLAFAEDGKVGIEQATDLVPDLIVSDVMMPEKDGFEVCQILKQDTRTSHIPIVMLTAKADVSSKLAGLRRGADAYLAKPFNEEELKTRLRNLLASREKMRHYFFSVATASTAMMSKEETSETIVEDAFVRKAKAIIEANVANPEFTVQDLSRELGMSHSQLHRKLRALTGKSIVKLIRSIRLNHARELLKDQRLTVAAVAYDSGFSDPDYFYRVFKKTYDMTPTEFRKELEE